MLIKGDEKRKRQREKERDTGISIMKKDKGQHQRYFVHTL